MGKDGQANAQGIPEQNQPQHGQQTTGQQEDRAPIEGALDDETLAALKADAEEVRRGAEAKQQAVEEMRRAVEEQLARMNQIAYGPAYDERSRQLNLSEGQEKLNQLNQELFQLELAAEDAAHLAGEYENTYKQAWNIAHGIEPQGESNPVEEQELPDSDDLRRDEDRQNAGIMSEHELEELNRAAEAQQKEADRLHGDIQNAYQEAEQLDAQANEIVNRLGYYDDERRRKLDLGDVNTALAQTEQRIQNLMRQAEEAGQRARELRQQYEESKRNAEQYNQLQDEGFPEEEVEPNDPNAHDPIAKELAEQETRTREAYELARGQMLWIYSMIEQHQEKSPEERKADDIPLDVLQNGLKTWSQKLPDLKEAMEKAQTDILEHREYLKKNYIRREMTDPVRDQLDKIMTLNYNQDDPDDNGPKPVTGLSVHAGRLEDANANRHGSQQWRDMHKALSELKLDEKLKALQMAHTMAELDYDGEQINELRSSVDLAVEHTRRYVDYKSGTFLVKMGIGRGSEYLNEAQAALKYLRDIQACIQTMDKQYAEVAENAKAQFDPKPAAVPEEPKPQQVNTAPRTSLNRNVTNVRNKGNVGPHIP